MSTESTVTRAGQQSRSRGKVDPRAPRVGQAITMALLLAGIVLQEPAFVYAVAILLVTAVASRWRVDGYALLWKHVISRFVDRPTELESASPHRFSKLLGAGFTALASAAFLVGFPFVGYVLAGLVAFLAAIAVTTNICIGCRLYRQLSFFQRIGWI